MIHRRTTPEPAPLPPPSTIALHCVGSTLVELPLDPRPGASIWIATIRHAPELAEGWARHLWDPQVGRGWTIPNACTFGSTVEVGADVAGRRSSMIIHRWYGIAVGHEPQWLVVHGPFTGPDGAEFQADQWLSESRLEAVARNDPNQRNAG